MACNRGPPVGPSTDTRNFHYYSHRSDHGITLSQRPPHRRRSAVDGGFTDVAGVEGRLGPLATDAPIGLAEIVPNNAGTGPLAEARRQKRHRAIVILTHGGRPGLCPSNAESFLRPFGPPVLQVSNEEADSRADLARRGSEVTVIAHAKRTPAEAFNVLATIQGTDRALPPLVYDAA